MFTIFLKYNEQTWQEHIYQAGALWNGFGKNAELDIELNVANNELKARYNNILKHKEYKYVFYL